MPDKNSKKYHWEKKLTASFNFEGALEVAAAAAALAQGREELVCWFRRDSPILVQGPDKDRPGRQRQDHRLLSSKGPTEKPEGSLFPGNHRKQQRQTGNKIGISLEYPDLFKIARVMEEAALAILGWRKEIEGRREANGHDPAKNQAGKTETAEVF